MASYRTYDVLPVRRIIHGVGALAGLPDLLADARSERVVVITSRSVAAGNLMCNVASLCGSRLLAVFSETVPHNPAAVALKAANCARLAEADTIVSVGGGTATDVGKAVKLILGVEIHQPEDFVPFIVHKYTPAHLSLRRRSRAEVPLHIVVPTTLSGAEFSDSCAITDDVTLTKRLFIYEELTPDVIVLDPAATLDTPPVLWASTGVKAVDHAIEQIYARSATPVVTSLCLTGLRLLYRQLPATLAEPEALDRRMDCLHAKWMITFGMMNVMMGLSHGLGHQIGPRWHLQHGLTSCVTLPPVLRFNRPYSLREQCQMADAIGIQARGRRDEVVAEEFASNIGEFTRVLGLPTRFQEVGGNPDDFPAIAQDVLRDPVAASNPRPLTAEAEIVELLWEAWRSVA